MIQRFLIIFEPAPRPSAMNWKSRMLTIYIFKTGTVITTFYRGGGLTLERLNPYTMPLN